MERRIWLVVGVLAVAFGWWASRPARHPRVVADLIGEFGVAIEKRPTPDVFTVVHATVAGETKRAVLVREPSRLVYAVDVPDAGALQISLGLLESSWTVEGDGVLFRVLVGGNAPPEELLHVALDPFHRPADRGWFPFTVDLSDFAGETVRVFFNTNSSLPAEPARDDRRGDDALWGGLRVVAR